MLPVGVTPKTTPYKARSLHSNDNSPLLVILHTYFYTFVNYRTIAQ